MKGVCRLTAVAAVAAVIHSEFLPLLFCTDHVILFWKLVTDRLVACSSIFACSARATQEKERDQMSTLDVGFTSNISGCGRSGTSELYSRKTLREQPDKKSQREL